MSNNFTFNSPGISIREIDSTLIGDAGTVGVPAGVVGTAVKGPAFVPMLVGTQNDFLNVFGPSSDGTRNGPLAMLEWLRNAQAGVYLRVLGAGKGLKRETTGTNIGKVLSAGFVVGDRQPNTDGALVDNPYAVSGGPLGRTYFLGAYMSESAGSNYFSSAGLQSDSTAAVVLRGVLMAASGVVLQLTPSVNTPVPSTTLPATAGNLVGSLTGTVNLNNGRQEFVMVLNGHKGLSQDFPNVVSASFDMTSPSYFGLTFNRDPLKLQEAGYVLYSSYDIHPNIATITGTNLITSSYLNPSSGYQNCAFLTTGSQARDAGAYNSPNFENFEDRYCGGETPWIVSQKFGGQPQNLFKFFALDDGTYANNNIKISIENIRRAPNQSGTSLFGQFDVVVRKFSDNDSSKQVLERFSALNLNPTDPRYIAKIIGDNKTYFTWDVNKGSQKVLTEGNYPNRSKFIRVLMDELVTDEEIDPTALPVGFRGPYHLVTSGSMPLTNVQDASQLAVTDVLKRAVQPPIPYRKTISLGSTPNQVTNRNLYWGVQFELQNDPTESNATAVLNASIPSWTNYFPTFQTEYMNVWAGNNAGTPNMSGTILDSDVFNNNLFSLENIQVVTGTGDVVDINQTANWSYVRSGQITANASAKTRAWKISDLDTAGVSQVSKFTTFMQGGFDGVRIFDKETRELSNTAITQEVNNPTRGLVEGPTVQSYMTSIDIMKNTNEVDIKLLAIPGIRNSVVTDQALAATEERFDALYLMDIQERDTNNQVITSSLQDVSVVNTINDFNGRGLNSSFGAVYFPDVVINDNFTQTTVRVAPSVAVLGAIAFNDAVAYPWFATAGFARGSLPTTDSTAIVLTQEDLDSLYPARINPLAMFGGTDSVVIWGQKTVYDTSSALERVNVRRLLIEIRRQVKEIANQIIFEPNKESTLNKFSALVQPILKRVQEQKGVDRYKVMIDTTTTTQADIENNTIRGRIYVQPTRTLEFVELTFNVTNAIIG